MRKWQIEPIQSIGGTSPRKLVFTGNVAYPWASVLSKKQKKESLFVSWLRDAVGRVIQYL